MWHVFTAALCKTLIVLYRTCRDAPAVSNTGIPILFFAVFLVSFLPQQVVSSAPALLSRALAALVIGAGMTMLAFASERENRTLNTVLVSCLSLLAVLLAKVAIYTLCAWVTVLLCMVAGWMIAGLIVGRLLIYNLNILSGGLFTGLMLAVLGALLWLTKRHFRRSRLILD
jgi:hypothetical protein